MTVLLPTTKRSDDAPIELPSITANQYSQTIASAAAEAALAQFSLPSRFRGAPTTLEEKLFDALADCKIIASRYAMHFERDWHRRLYAQLDMLMDKLEWDSQDVPVTRSSFTTFIRLLLQLGTKKRPGVGIANDGHIVASWSDGLRDRLTIECLPRDRLRWVVSRTVEDAWETGAGETSLDRILQVLDPYDPRHWFNEGAKPTG